MVVVDPDEVPLDAADGLDDDVGKGLVGLDVAAPEVGVEPPRRGGRERQEVVEQRPELLLAEAPVVPLAELGPQEDRAAPERGVELEGDDFLLRRGDVVGGEASDVEDVDVVADALLFLCCLVCVFFGGWVGRKMGGLREWRMKRERERERKGREREREKRVEEVEEAKKKEKESSIPHRCLRDQRVLVPLKLPLSRGGGPLHLDRQVVGDEDEAVLGS